MASCGLIALVISFAFFVRCCDGQKEATETAAEAKVEPLAESSIRETTTQGNVSNEEYPDMEIIGIRVLPKIGNAVELTWGRPLRGFDLNWTYGVYYGPTEEEALREPKLTTTELFGEAQNLSFCSQYIFAVGVVNANTTTFHPPRNTRTISTQIDPLQPPADLRVEFIPAEHPCLLIKWSASCPNIALPLGYSVTVAEKNPVRMIIITEPRTTSLDLSQTLRVLHAKSYDVKVATDAVGAAPTETVSYTVPHFLQPYKVRLTSQPDGTFVVYWREPYVPYYVGPYYYEVYVYPGRSLASKHQVFATDKPIFAYKGNLTEYTFMVGLRSVDGMSESLLTDPLAKSLNGPVSTLNVS